MSRNGLKIIIVGAGKIARTIVAQLVDEGHDLTIVDISSSVVEEFTQAYDCMGVVGNGATYATLKEAGIETADLFIAVTASDELNLLCCTIAKQFGDAATIARVRNPEYSREVGYLRDKLGLAMIINPELEAAREIARILFLPTALEINSFAHGHAELIKIRLPEGNMLDGKSIAYLGKNITNDILICAVERDGNIVIPHGDFVLQSGDILSFAATRKSCLSFLKLIGFNTKGVRDTMIVGGGIACYYLADQLIRSGIDVKIIESDFSRCEELSELLPKATIINADATDKELLLEAGIHNAQSFVPLTGIDEENIILSLYAKEVSNAKLVTKITRITFSEVIGKLDLGSVVYPKYITSESILTYVRAKQATIGSNIETLYQLFDSRAEALEFSIHEGSAIIGVPLKDLKLKKDVLIGFIYHKDTVIIPSGNDVIHEGDSVLIVTTHHGFTEIGDVLL
ncbi:MAG: Trk system potassium transporter TrkA [Clostridiales bacterium]|nr:Trk system potassium transporter TrkA [Clostridiales bacterium]